MSLSYCPRKYKWLQIYHNPLKKKNASMLFNLKVLVILSNRGERPAFLPLLKLWDINTNLYNATFHVLSVYYTAISIGYDAHDTTYTCKTLFSCTMTLDWLWHLYTFEYIRSPRYEEYKFGTWTSHPTIPLTKSRH